MEKLLIGAIARKSGVPIKTVRYYEEVGVLPKAARTVSGYRCYPPDIVDRLRFIKSAQRLGLSLKDIRRILNLADRGRCPCGHVQKMLEGCLTELRRKMQDLKLLEKRVLVAAARKCPDDFKPKGNAICPTIQGGIGLTKRGGRR